MLRGNTSPSRSMSAARSALLMDDTRFFFEKGHVGGQPSDLFVELPKLLLVGEPFGVAIGILPLKEAGEPLERGRLPQADQIRMDVVLGGDLAHRFLAAQDLLDALGFECGMVVLSHPVMLHLILPRSTVQFSGSTIPRSLPYIAWWSLGTVAA